MSEQTNPEQSDSPVKTTLWLAEVEPLEGYEVAVTIERTDPDEVALFTAPEVLS